MAKNWADRSAGAIRAFRLDSNADRETALYPLGQPGFSEYRPFGSQAGAQSINYIDTSVKPLGTQGSLTFVINSGPGSESAAGVWWTNFSDDGSVKFGANSQCFIQWRQRWNQAFIDTYLEDSGGGTQAGIKQMDVVCGDTLVPHPNGGYTSNTNYGGFGISSSNDDGKIVVQSRYHSRFTAPYRYMWTPNPPLANQKVNRAIADEVITGDPIYQNQTAPLCRSSGIAPPPSTAAGVGCFPWVADQWTTWQIMVKLGAAGTYAVNGVNYPCWNGFEFKMWAGYEGQPQQLIHYYHPGLVDYEPLLQHVVNPGDELTDPDDRRFGKMYLFPFMTDKSETQVHPTLQTWYSEVIVSTAFIDDPLDEAAPTPQPSVTRVAVADRLIARGSVSRDIAVVTGVTGSVAATEAKDTFAATNQQYPAWRRNLTKETWAEISATAPLSTASPPGPYTYKPIATDGGDFLISGWNGFARIGTEWWTAAASGHGQWQNPVLRIDFKDDIPAWKVVDNGSDMSAAVLSSDYYTDGRATGRHQYYTPCGVPAGICPDGKKRVIMPTTYTRWGGTPDATSEGGYSMDVFAFRCDDGMAHPDTNQWDPDNFWPAWPGYVDNNIASVCQDPRNYKMYVTLGDADNGFYILDPATMTWARGYTNPGYPNTSRVNGWPHYPTLIDTVRNRLVAFANSPFADPPETLHRFTTVDLSHAGTPADPFPLAVFPWSGDAVRTSAAPYFGPKSSRMVHDLDNDRYLLMVTNEAGTATNLFSIDPNTWVITNLNKSIGPLNGTDAVESKFHYFPSLGGCAILRSGTSNIQFFPTR